MSSPEHREGRESEKERRESLITKKLFFCVSSLQLHGKIMKLIFQELLDLK